MFKSWLFETPHVGWTCTRLIKWLFSLNFFSWHHHCGGIRGDGKQDYNNKKKELYFKFTRQFIICLIQPIGRKKERLFSQCFQHWRRRVPSLVPNLVWQLPPRSGPVLQPARRKGFWKREKLWKKRSSPTTWSCCRCSALRVGVTPPPTKRLSKPSPARAWESSFEDAENDTVLTFWVSPSFIFWISLFPSESSSMSCNR